MALPIINETPKYHLTIPSTKKKVFFRPFLVKEQKILLMALESQDQKTIVRAISDIINACVVDHIKPRTLSTFDVEYMFTQIRAKSVGETSEISLKCAECEEPSEVTIDLSKIKVEVESELPLIDLNDKYKLKMKYPSYDSLLDVMPDTDEENSLADVLFRLSLVCLDQLMTEDEAINFDEESKEERIKFLDNLNSEQFQDIMSFVQSLPKLTEDVKFECSSCNHQNEYKLEGLDDFF
jgi:hypothetical protein